MTESVCPTCGSTLTHDDDGGTLDEDDEEFVAEQFDAVYQQAIRYIECPCHYHAYCFGVGTMCVPGFTFGYVLHAVITEVTKEYLAGDYVPPEGCSVLVLNDFLDQNDPAADADDDDDA
jgi:hypothetical protein